MAGEQPWCATPTAMLCCWGKESWIDDCQTAAIRADRPQLNQQCMQWRDDISKHVRCPIIGRANCSFWKDGKRSGARAGGDDCRVNSVDLTMKNSDAPA